MAVNQESALAATYARALLDLANARDATDAVREELDELTAAMQASPDLSNLLTNPAIDDAQRERVLEKTFRGQMSDLLLNTLLVMTRKGRAALTQAVHASFTSLLAEQRRQATARVTTAYALDDERRQRVIDAISVRTGKQITLEETVDPDILGGIIVQVGDELVDGSLTRQLQRIRSRLHERASQEILALRDAVEE